MEVRVSYYRDKEEHMRKEENCNSGSGTTADSKEENIRDMKWKPSDQRANRGARQIKMRKVKQ